MSEKPETWKINSSRQVADCRVFKVREDMCERSSDSKESTFFVIENPDWVNVIALTKNNEVVLIEQFRHGAEEIILEIPGGMIDDDEEPEPAAKRELLEETGYSSDNFIFLGKSLPNPAIQNNFIHHFLAVDCQKTGDTSFDEHESVVTKLVSFDKISEMIETEEIAHSLVLAAFYRMSLNPDFAKFLKKST